MLMFQKSGFAWLAAVLFGGPVWAADLVLQNARIYTVDAERSWATSLAVSNGRIVYVGMDASAHVTDTTDIIDMHGSMVLPGFQDAHSHLASGGVAYTACPVFDLPDGEAVLRAIGDCVEDDPESELIRGDGWDISQFAGGKPPRKELLDAIDNTRPLVFGDSDGHALWLNSAAFAAFGITDETPDPPGGMIERNPETGALWGTLHEESAFKLVTNHWPPFSDTEIMAGIRYGQNYYHSLGITALQEAIVKLDGRDSLRSLSAYATMNASGELKLRASMALFWEAGAGQAQIETFKKARTAHDGGRLKVNMVKFWADGVVETRTARMLEPYSDQPDTVGLLMIPREELMDGVRRVDAEGFQVHIHAIGDATVRYGLDAIEAAWAANGRRDGRHHINHLQFVDPADVGRFQALGVGASFEPYWAYEDVYITELTRPRVGPKRIQWTYPIGSIMKTGATVAFSSDWSVSSADPLLGIETAITRVDPHTNEGESFLPGERIGLVDAIAAYTINAAYLGKMDDTSGSIEVGKYADLVVLDRNLFEIPVTEISDAKVLATVFEGELVYGNYPNNQKR